MIYRISFRVFATFALLGGLSTTTQGAPSLEASPVVSHSAVVDATPQIASPVVPMVAAIAPAPSVALPSAIVASAVPAVSDTPSLTPPVSTALPTIAPPKTAKKKPRRLEVRRAIRRPVSAASVPVVAAYNQPYVQLGVKYTPIHNAINYFQRGEATWYSNSHQGQATVNGEIYDVYGMTAAHQTLPIPSYARVTNMSNQKSVVVRINDRGPFGHHKKIIDLSYAAANKIGLVGGDNRRVEILSLAQDMPMVLSKASKAKITFRAAHRPPLNTRAFSKKPVSNVKAAGGVYLQLGAFKTLASAEAYKGKVTKQLGELQYPLAIFEQENLHRLRVGPYASREAAEQVASEVTRVLGFKPILK